MVDIINLITDNGLYGYLMEVIMTANILPIETNEEFVVACPPSVPIELWDSVPKDLKREFIEEAALALVRGVHPIDTFNELLDEKGIFVNYSNKSQVIIKATNPSLTNNNNVEKVDFKSKIWGSKVASGPIPPINNNEQKPSRSNILFSRPGARQ